MHKSFIITLLCILSTPVFASDKISPNCTFNGKSLYGRVKIVKSFADFKVKKTSLFPDLNVRYVKNFANSCGEWNIVESFPDFTVEFVNSFEDFSINENNLFPGL